MGMYFDFPAGWWVLLALIYVPYLFLSLGQKSSKKRGDFSMQFVVGIISVLIALVVEFIAVNLQVWTYFPGNWPVVLWVAYFGVGLLGYQIIRRVEFHFGKQR